MATDHDKENQNPDTAIVKGEIVDERTGEVIPVGVPAPIAKAMYTFDVGKIGTLELNKQANDVLDEPLDDADVQIRPDGLVYLSWAYYAKKLNKAFGRLQWGIIPNGNPQSKDTGYDNVLVAWGFWLIVKGTPISFSIGETTYRTTNSTMSYADACEGAKSSALARNCKQLGISLELWDKEWIEAWKAKYAETYKGKNDKTLWRKKGSKPAAKPAEKPAPKTEPAAHTEPASADVGDGDNMPETATTAQELSDGYTGKQILDNKNGQMKALIGLTGKAVVDICKFAGAMEKGKKLTLQQIADMITQGEK